MFAAERWAWAFINTIGEDKEALDTGLAALKDLTACIQKIPGVVSGKASANHLEQMIRRSMEKSGVSGGGTEYAGRILLLLVKKRLFTKPNGAALVEEIEKIRDRKNGILLVRVDSAFPLDEEFQKTLKETVKEGVARKMGAQEIKLIPRIVPELLGGYRLQIGSESVDASLRFLLQKMAVDLQAVRTAGGVAW